MSTFDDIVAGWNRGQQFSRVLTQRRAPRVDLGRWWTQPKPPSGSRRAGGGFLNSPPNRGN